MFYFAFLNALFMRLLVCADFEFYRRKCGANSLRDGGGVPRKTEGFVGCRRGRQPLRFANSRGAFVGRVACLRRAIN